MEFYAPYGPNNFQTGLAFNTSSEMGLLPYPFVPVNSQYTTLGIPSNPPVGFVPNGLRNGPGRMVPGSIIPWMVDGPVANGQMRGYLDRSGYRVQTQSLGGFPETMRALEYAPYVAVALLVYYMLKG